jgi:hypothetical protein
MRREITRYLLFKPGDIKSALAMRGCTTVNVVVPMMYLRVRDKLLPYYYGTIDREISSSILNSLSSY